MAGTLAYLGGTQINAAGLYFGDILTEFNPFTPISGSIPTGSIQLYIDASSWNGTDNTINSIYGTATASLSNVTKVENAFNFTTSSAMSFSASAAPLVQNEPSTIVLVYRSSGSATDHHGRILNGNNNWLFGTYGGGPGTPADETMYSYYNGGFVIDSGSYDTNWHMMTGVLHSVYSQSIYINSTYKTGYSGAARSLFVGLGINRGAFSTNESTQCDVGALLIYNRELSPTEITEIYNNYSSIYNIQ